MFDVLQERKNQGFSTRRFTGKEMEQEINNPRNVPHYETKPIAEELTDNIISDFLDYNLVERTDPSEEGYSSDTDLFEIRSKIDGTRPDTVRDNIRKEYKKKWIASKAEWEARGRAVRKFEETHSGIEDWTDD